MRILVVSQYYTPDITAAAFRVSETVTHLRSLGHDVKVVTTFPHKSQGSDGEALSENGVYRVQLPDTENEGFWGYLYLYLSFLIKSVLKGLRVGAWQRPHVVWATSPPIFTGLSGWMLAKLLGAGFALDVRDIWPESAVAAGQISGSGIAYKAGRWLEKFLYRQADLITCVARPMQNYIQWYTDRPVRVIYNGADLPENGQERAGRGKDLLQERATAQNARKILYAGNFGHVQQLDLLIEAYSEINKREWSQNWEIFLLGGGARKEDLVQLTEKKGVADKVHFLDPVPKNRVFGYLKSADVLFIHLMESKVLRLTIPSKVFDYMLVNRPLVAGIAGEGKEIIDSVSGNITFTPGDKESLKIALKKMDQEISGNAAPDNASVVTEKYSRKVQSEELNQILRRTFEF